jgi:hypothetical protein
MLKCFEFESACCSLFGLVASLVDLVVLLVRLASRLAFSSE